METTGLFFCILLLLPACFAHTKERRDLAEAMEAKLEEVSSLDAADEIQRIQNILDGGSGSGSGSGSSSGSGSGFEFSDDEEFTLM